MTTNPLRAARGTTATLNTRALKEGELAYNTDTEELHVGDGSTLGGRPISSEVDGDDIDVTATGSTTARSLADRFADVYRPEDFGAVGDGTTDDTTAFQACLDALGEGDCVLLTPGATYSVTNLTLPTNSAAASSGKPNGLVCIGGMATIKCRSGGDTDYMVATDLWLTANANKSYASSPWHVANIAFDGNSIAAKTVAHKSFWSVWENCYFLGGTDTDFEHTRQNQDTSNGTGASTYLAGRWVRCRFKGTAATYQFRSRGRAVDDMDANTDCTLIDCEFQGAADYGLYIGNGGGWTVMGCRFYSQTTAAARVLRVSRGWLWTGNNMDSDGTAPGLILGEVGSYPEVLIGPGNKWYTDIRCDFKADASDERIVIQGDHFDTQPAGSPDANVIHNNNSANKVVTIKDCSFEANPVYERGSGVTAGLVEVINSTSASATGDARNIAYLKDDPGATAGPVIRKVRRSASPAASDVLARDEYIGDDAGGNLTTYAACEAVISDTTDASEDGTYRIKIMVAGSEVTAITYDSAGATVRGALLPSASDGGAIGSASLMWSDLFLASGAVLNFDNGNFTVTHAAGALAFAGGQVTFTTTSAGTGGVKSMNTTDAASVQALRIEGDRATPAANDEVYESYYLSNGSGTQTEVARITAAATVVTAGAESGAIYFETINAGSFGKRAVLTAGALRPNANDGLPLGTASVGWSDLFLASGAVINFNNGDVTITHSTDTLTFAGAANGFVFNQHILSGAHIKAHQSTAIPAGGTTGAGFTFSSAANFGVFFGSGAPTLSAAQGSLYLRSDGSSTSTRAYINTDGGTTWTNLVTAA